MIVSDKKLEDILNDSATIKELKAAISDNELIKIKNAVPGKIIQNIKSYLKNVGSNSFPQYYPIVKGCPNFHRINDNDERAYVKGIFHQFVFYPWNQDYFDLFEKFRLLFYLKNALSGIAFEKFCGREPENQCTSRIAIQFYPKGSGFLEPHKDPVDYHQIAVPILIMSEKGKDYETGGLFIEKDGEKQYLDDNSQEGDVVYFNASLTHGVDTIDPDKTSKWLDFDGRWMGLLAVNKLANNNLIQNAQPKTT